VDFVNFLLVSTKDRKIKDLCDCKELHAASYQGGKEWRLLP